MRVRRFITSGLLAAGISAVGIAVLAGPASAHNLTGGSAEATCVGDTAQVTWSYVSGDAGSYTIQSVAFNRSVLSSSHTDTTVTARTNEPVGQSLSLQATVTFDDGYQSAFTATTTVPDDICPPPTTTTTEPPTTTVPPTTVPPTTTPTTPPPTVVPAVPTAPPTVPTTAAVVPRQVTTTVAVRPVALPTTGSSSTLVIIAGVAALLVGGVLLLAGRRGEI